MDLKANDVKKTVRTNRNGVGGKRISLLSGEMVATSVSIGAAALRQRKKKTFHSFEHQKSFNVTYLLFLFFGG